MLASHYDTGTYLVWLQTILDLRHDPDTSELVTAELESISARAEASIVRLVRQATGEEVSLDDAHTMFHVVRGFAISKRVADAVNGRPVLDRHSNGFNKFLRQLALSYATPSTRANSPA